MTDSPDPIQNKVSTHLLDKPILFVSSERMENRLLQQFLEKETGAECHGVECLEHVPVIEEEKANTPALILFDCFRKNRDAILTELTTIDWRTFTRSPLCLFNVPHGTGLEAEAVKQGVQGFFYQDDSLEHFLKGISAIRSGELWISRDIMTQCVKRNARNLLNSEANQDTPLLTVREKEIMTLVANGLSNTQIAEELFISPHTVKTHVYNAFKKIKVPNRLQAALWTAKNL
jgi:DNA-binding NarL/FixJ family response regulator